MVDCFVLLLVALVPGALALPMAVDPPTTCSESLHQFLSRLSTQLNQSDFQLHVGVPRSDRPMETLCQTSTYSMELWRVLLDTKAPRPTDFGTKDYFSKYENCERPNPDLFWMHGEFTVELGHGVEDREAELGHGVKDGEADLGHGMEDREAEFVAFQHILAKEYVIRMCPCTEQNSCSCVDLPEKSPVACSHLISVNEQASSDLVFDWCRDSGPDSDLLSPKASLLTPVIQHCPPKIRLQGTLPSCTPIRHYDLVEIVLQPFSKKDGPPDCGRHSEDAFSYQGGGGKSKVIQRVELGNINQTHGTFSAEITNISLDTYYCLKVELVDHPYCMSRKSSVSFMLENIPSVCRAISVKKPILMEAAACPADDVSVCTESTTNLPLVIGASCGVAVCIVIILIVACRVCRKRRSSSRLDLTHSDKLLSSSPRLHHPDIFFLYFADCSELVAVNSLLGRWMGGLGHKVIDLADNNIQEEMAASPEVWITEKIEDPGVKVVVVKSAAADRCLEAGREADGSVGMNRLDNKDAMDPLRVFSLRQVQARLTGNYRRLAVLQCWEGGEGATLQLVPHTRHLLPDHLPELQAWLADTASYDGNDNLGGGREQTLKDLKAAVHKYCNSAKRNKDAITHARL